MAAKFVAIMACLLALTQVNGLQVNSDGKIKLQVVTTSGCGDTVSFIRDQLAGAYELYKDFLDVEFVPWGRSTWDGVGQIQCQFLAADCWANRLHRCALNILKDDQEAQVKYMTCEFRAPFPSFVGGSYACAQESNINLIELDHCVSNNHDELDRQAQLAAAEPMRLINFVPAIVFNDSIDLALHEAARFRLASMICFALAEYPASGITSCQI
ncbi:gamma-interferon-inducible lysosomal thiol reductase-like protein [Anticarsia gemmatalis]|uniref:gamma-interferon-inducible lysosomal thiol reductase-like protein n=1 Tax=Anticarsia gemmatalis TaxID=129554 RepID=UPI003F75F39F